MAKQVSALERESAAPEFWNDSVEAQAKMRRLSSLTAEIEEWRGLDGQARSIEELLTLALEERDDSIIGSLVEEAAAVTEKLETLEFKLVLSGRYDRRNGIIAVHAGAGGVESQDWAGMLLRMYVRWAERRGYESDVLDVSRGEEGGIKSAMLQISGDYAYGYLRAERGVHRLVRLSPFDADHARHTSFALLEVLPEVEEAVDISIDPDDLRIDVFRAGGAGGQNVQKNSTAVRITHLPTGVKVSCQNERSQYQNKAIAMRILGSRLLEREVRKRAEEVAKLKGEHVSAEGGNQIRSYVLHPYRMVKDHRTDFQTSDTEAVLNGDIDGFINAFLSDSIGRGKDVEPDNGAGSSP
jgi:peptide chain release factor 2